jgi:uncharacterized phage protein (TIGR02220 family)/predicted phage replisome organizer
MADVKWIKITTDIFDDEKILLIESMPSADSIIVIWFKLLTFAGKQNNDGVFMMSNRIAYTDEMLASIFRRDINTVRMALNAFVQFGMIEVIDNVITIPNWNKHQTLDAYEKKKARDRLYQAERRANQKALIQKSSDTSTDDKTRASSDIVISDIDKEIDKDKEIYISIVEYLNEKAGTGYKATTAKTKTAIKARLAEGFTLEDFKTVIDKKCTDWLGSEYEQYLRPETLFGTKFESYLNAKIMRNPQQRKVGANGIAISSEKSDLEGVF